MFILWFKFPIASWFYFLQSSYFCLHLYLVLVYNFDGHVVLVVKVCGPDGQNMGTKWSKNCPGGQSMWSLSSKYVVLVVKECGLKRLACALGGLPTSLGLKAFSILHSPPIKPVASILPDILYAIHFSNTCLGGNSYTRIRWDSSRDSKLHSDQIFCIVIA